MKLFDNIVSALHKNMDMRLFRQGLINANIANAETPGYRPRDVVFQEQLAQFMEIGDEKISATQPRHFYKEMAPSDVTGELIEQAGETSPDNNLVDLDRQMAELAANSSNYRASAKIVSKKLALMKYIINETR